MEWKTVKRIDDEQENVAKFVFTNETAVAESVLYRYPTYDKRTVICCSTQSGCPVGCRFCGAGDHFVRNLSAVEIVDQPDYLLQQTGIDPAVIERLQIMFMSMGEPLLNFAALETALYRLYEKYPQAALLISTSGPDVPFSRVIYVSRQIPTIGLQFSVHESTDERRNDLIPFKRKMTLRQIADAGVRWARETGRNPFFNYCAHDHNVSADDAIRLRDLFNPDIWEATISVVCERSNGFAVSNEHQRSLALDFGAKLGALGYSYRVFDPAGQDTIGGGCGQLWFVQNWMVDNPDLAKPSVGSGLPEIHAPN